MESVSRRSIGRSIDGDSWYRNDRTLEGFEGRFVADEIEPLDGVKYYPLFHHARKDCMRMPFTRQYCFLLCVNFLENLNLKKKFSNNFRNSFEEK